MGFSGHRAAKTTRSGSSRPKPNSPVLNATNTLANSGYRLQTNSTTSLLPIPKYLLLGMLALSRVPGSQLFPWLRVNHHQGPARERIQLRCRSVSLFLACCCGL
ncbi:AABR07058124.4 [Phodopus roborovskii]|uniref:AABR07058124.4 protein n=1 Tax=Phodopus roborovskii TaxID=109678 RepID=A0AAV0A4C9_PHORO|nr:AABR07058124.4 [Phodopus roborovskii]